MQIGKFGLAMVAAALILAAPSRAQTPIARVFVIAMENHGFDQVIGANGADGAPVTPYITRLAADYGLATWHFGVTHPSLPNYIAMIGGDTFGIADDADSCFNPSHGTPCNAIDSWNLIDQLEAAGIRWTAWMESMPSAGFLGSVSPSSANPLYAQKHNPFLYFRSIATNPARLQNIKPFSLAALQADLVKPILAPRFTFIAPNQCNDQHGTPACTGDDALRAAGDAFLQQVVPVIMNSPTFQHDVSVIFITWDEGAASNMNCCGRLGGGGGHVATIVVTNRGAPNGPRRSALATDHYSLLATIQDGFGLPRIGNAQAANSLADLIPPPASGNAMPVTNAPAPSPFPADQPVLDFKSSSVGGTPASTIINEKAR